MPYSKDHTQNARRRILDSAVQLFSQHGYDGVTLDEIMLGAKLTRGAFYGHFNSKRKIYVYPNSLKIRDKFLRFAIRRILLRT